MLTHSYAYNYDKYHPGSHFPFFLVVFLISCFFLTLRLTKAPIVPDRISFWWKLKAGVALLFHLGGCAGFLFSLGLLVSVGPVPHAWLQWVMLSNVLAGFGTLCLFFFFFVWVTHSLRLFTSSISQVVTRSENKHLTHSMSFSHAIYLTVDSLKRKENNYCSL